MRIVGLGVVGLLSACATFSEPPVPSKPAAVFPSVDELHALEVKSGAVPTPATAEVPAEGWTVDPARAVVTPLLAWAPEGVWDQAFARAFATPGRKARLTGAMSCVAGELGRFNAQHGAMPPESLQRFVSAACGVYQPFVCVQSLVANAAPDLSDETLLARYEPQLGRDLADKLPTKATEVGFWFGRHGDRIVAMAAYGVAPVELAPFSVVPVGGTLTIEGRLLAEGDGFEAYVNQGRFGVTRCLLDPGVMKPRFRASCHLADGDETAWVEVVYAPKGTVLALPLVQVLARRDPRQPLRFLEPPPTESHVAAGAADFRAAVLAGLNAVRARASLPPVRLAAAQSEVASRVARPYFAASLGAGSAADLNTVVLGMLAGWQVPGLIRGGSFFSALLPNTRDVGRWLDFALALPLGRFALLDPEVEEIACGPTFLEESRGVGAIVTSYRFQRDDAHTADVAALHARIQAIRKRRGLAPAERIRGGDEIIAEELERVRRDERSPMQAMYGSMQGMLGNVNRLVRGVYCEATSLDALELPPELLADPSIRYELGVTHHKPPGAAWSQLVIVIVYVRAPRIEA